MMFDVSINWLLIGILSVAAWVLGFLWFVVVFRKAYMTGHGRTKAQLDSGPSTLVASIYQLFGAVLQVSVLAWLVALTGADSAVDGVVLGLLVWLGFIVGFIGPMYAFQAYSLKYTAIIIGYPFIVLTSVGAILTVF